MSRDGPGFSLRPNVMPIDNLWCRDGRLMPPRWTTYSANGDDLKRLEEQPTLPGRRLVPPRETTYVACVRTRILCL